MDTCRIVAAHLPETEQILTPEFLEFLAVMQRAFRQRRRDLLQVRMTRQQHLDAGGTLDFLPESRHIRDEPWTVDNTPDDLQDRRVEITGPTDRKMIINALNSGAKVFMADFEDSNAPTFENCIRGQQNLCDAVRRNITYTDPVTGKQYALNPNPAVLMVRPRGWHLDEAHVLCDDEPVSASLFDALVYLFHNAKALLERNTGPYFYLPKLESALEAELWNDVLLKAQEYLGLQKGSVKVTVLIETIPAAFEMHEIIFALRDHIVGLNCGRWDYIFSFIKKFRNHPDCVLPDRQQVTMTSPFLAAYVTLLIQTCHTRGIHALGGMAAQIPIRDDPAANDRAIAKVFEDKKREVLAGHDGTWVAHPGLVPVALQAFDTWMPQANQLSRIPDAQITRENLLEVPAGQITEAGVRTNIRVALLYLKSWVAGNGCVPVNHLMEDAATAEICRAQLWQWLRFDASMEDARPVDRLFIFTCMQSILEEETTACAGNQKALAALSDAFRIMELLIYGTNFEAFLTEVAYPILIGRESS